MSLLIVGTLLGLLLTRHGVNLADDADTYIGVARNLADGHGLTVPFTNVLDPFSPATAVGFHGEVPLLLFGPLLSLVLAPFEWLGIASVDVVRYLNPVLLGLSLAVLGLLAWRITRRSLVLSLAVVLLSLHTSMLELFGFVQSETLFVPLTLAALLFLGRWAATGRTRCLVAFTAFAALASLARMVGVSLALVGVVAVILWSTERWTTRAARAVAVAAGALGPLLVFTLYERSLIGSGRGRPLSFRLPGTYDFRPSLDSVTRWLLPTDPTGAIDTTHRWLVGSDPARHRRPPCRSGLALPPPDPGDRRTRRPRDGRRRRGASPARCRRHGDPRLSPGARRGAHDHRQQRVVPVRRPTAGACAPAALVAGRRHRGAVVDVDPIAAGRARNRRDRGRDRVGPGVAHLTRTGEVLGWDGPGVNPAMAESPTPEIVNRLAGDGVVFSNAPNRIWNGSGRDAVTIPARTVALSGEPNEHLRHDIEEMRTELRDHGGVVVYQDGNFLTTLHLCPSSNWYTRGTARDRTHSPRPRIYALAP